MTEPKPEYLTDALEMIGAGYEPAVEIEQGHTVIHRRNGKMESIDKPAFVKISTAFKKELSEISGDALKVWLFICLSINRGTGKANPGLRTIAAAVSLSVNTIQKCLEELENLELLVVDRQSRKYNLYESPEYVSANRSEPTVSNRDTDAETVSNLPETVSNSDETVSRVRGDFLLNQKNQKNQSKPDLISAMLESGRREQLVKDAQIAFESAFGFGTLPWDTKHDWQKFSKWVATTHQKDPRAFADFVEWRNTDGKYKGAMTNTAIRRDPQMFMDTGYPTFLAHSAMYGRKSQPVTTDEGGLYV